jgi:hypothetical protein
VCSRKLARPVLGRVYSRDEIFTLLSVGIDKCTDPDGDICISSSLQLSFVKYSRKGAFLIIPRLIWYNDTRPFIHSSVNIPIACRQSAQRATRRPLADVPFDNVKQNHPHEGTFCGHPHHELNRIFH